MTRLLSLAFAVLLSSATLAAEPPVYTGLLSNTGAGGYDVVAYFEQGQPVEGSSKFTTEYLGATWRFASEAHLKAFEADPQRYAPQYGGYCAWAASQGYLAKGDPRHWTVVNGRLFLNYNQDIQDRWLANRDNFIQQADANWPSILEN